jgi:hypothetical protein
MFVLTGPLAALLAGCSNGTAGTTTPPTSAPATSSGSTSAPGTTGSTTAPAGGAIPPVTDASAVRDQLLQIAKGYHYTKVTKDTGLVSAWQQAFPNMKVTLFYDQPATADTFSLAQSYTFPSGASDDHAYDSILGFAVMDQKGACAGGVVVIPEKGPGEASDALPSVFAPVDMSNASKCSAEVAQDTYGKS